MSSGNTTRRRLARSDHQRWRHGAGRPRLSSEQLAWAERWWPSGDRAEIGLTRDRAWVELVKMIIKRGGCALVIDYGHVAAQRPTHRFAGRLP